MSDFPAFSPATVHRVGPEKYEASHGADSDLIVQFELLPVHMAFKSEQEGRPIYEEKPHVRIAFPGDRTRELLRPVKMQDDPLGPSDVHRFPRQWAAFQAQQEPVSEGTPIAEWPVVNRAQVMELASMNVRTVEQLANVPDTTLHNMGMGGRALRDRAKTWLDNARGGSEMSKVYARLEALEAENQALKLHAASALETDPISGEPIARTKSTLEAERAAALTQPPGRHTKRAA